MKYTRTIKKNTIFKSIYYHSRFKIGFLTVIYLKKNSTGETNLGVTVSKKVGNAVIRNRVRRIIFAAYFELEKKQDFKGYSFVIVARRACGAAGMWDVFKELEKNFSFLKKYLSKKRKFLK